MVQNIAVDCPLGTSCIVHHGKSILPGLQKVVFYRSSSVAIIGQRSLNTPRTSLSFELEDGLQKTEEYDYKVQDGPGTTHKVTDEPFCLQRSEEKQNVIDDEIQYFVTE